MYFFRQMNNTIKVKTETVPTLAEVVRHIYDITIGHVIPGPVLGYQLFQTIVVTRR